MKAPHNSRWHTAVGSPLPRSARAKSITVRRVYERAEDEEKKRKTRARTRARDEIFTLFSRPLSLPGDFALRERASLAGGKLYFRSSIAFVHGEYPVS